MRRSVLVPCLLTLAVLTALPRDDAAASPGVTTRVSVTGSGGQLNGTSNHPAISQDGRFVAFASTAPIDGDAGEASRILVHDLNTKTTRLYGADNDDIFDNPNARLVFSPAGDSVDSKRSTLPVSSTDGRFVAFDQFSAKLAPGNATGDVQHTGGVYVYDRVTGLTELVSVNSSGEQASGGFGMSAFPAVSAEGRFVAFMSWATNLVPEDTNGVVDIFVHDRNAGLTERVSVDNFGHEGDCGSDDPSVSGDGRFVAFESCASNLVPGDTNGASDIFVHDRAQPSLPDGGGDPASYGGVRDSLPVVLGIALLLAGFLTLGWASRHGR